jgi:hypothetical protein
MCRTPMECSFCRLIIVVILCVRLGEGEIFTRLMIMLICFLGCEDGNWVKLAQDIVH